jgi:ankyrin repeat protein
MGAGHEAAAVSGRRAAAAGRPAQSRAGRVAAIGCGTSTAIGGILLVLMLVGLSSMSRSCTIAFQRPCTWTDRDLNRAAKTGSPAEIEKLIREGADPNGRDPEGQTPLSCAAYGHHPDNALKLVDLGADATKLPPAIRSELLTAVSEHDDADTYGELVSRGLASTPPTEAELTRAIDDNADRMVAALLARGAPGAQALHYAVLSNKIAPVRLILDAPTPIPKPDGRESLLALAAYNDNPLIVDALLTHGADPNDGGVATQGATFGALRDITQRSPKGPSGSLFGVVVGNATLPGDVTPLVLASVRGNTTNVVRLLDAGADPNKIALGVYSPLYAAVIGGNPSTVTTLLARGAVPVPVVAPGTYTPRQLAQLNGRTEIERVLAEAEAQAGVDTSLPAEALPPPSTTTTATSASTSTSPATTVR